MTTQPFTIGSDPELMIFDKEAGKIVSSMPVLKRTKKDPIDLGNGVKVYADNVLAEASFRPISLIEDFAAHVRDVITRVQECLGGRYSLLPQSSHVYDADDLKHELTEMGDDGKVNTVTAFDIGCTPWFDVYTTEMCDPAPFKDGLRSSSMHIHLGNPDYKTDYEGHLMTIPSKEHAIKVMDIIVGCAAAIFDKDPSSITRRNLGYGKAGTFRLCPYGAEYRVLSSYGLRTPELTKLVHDLTSHAMSHISGGTVIDLIESISPVDIQHAINQSDGAMARKVLRQAALPAALMKRVEKTYDIPAFATAWGL